MPRSARALPNRSMPWARTSLDRCCRTARTQTRWLDDWRMRYGADAQRFPHGRSETEADDDLSVPARDAYDHAFALAAPCDHAGAVGDGTDGRRRSLPRCCSCSTSSLCLDTWHPSKWRRGLMAGFDVKLWTILQDVGQLQRHYEKTWQTFVANSGVVTAFGVSDSLTAKELSNKLGSLRMMEQVASDASANARLGGARPIRSIVSKRHCWPGTRSSGCSTGTKTAC